MHVKTVMNNTYGDKWIELFDLIITCADKSKQFFKAEKVNKKYIFSFYFFKLYIFLLFFDTLMHIYTRIFIRPKKNYLVFTIFNLIQELEMVIIF